MTVQPISRESQRLREIAREYRQRGYDVQIEPQPDQLPAFLAPFRVDLVAKNAEEHVVVEVRTQESLTDAPELDAIARVLDHQPTWRFELVVTNPRDRTALTFKNAIPLNDRDIVYRLREARQLSEQEHGEAAFLLAWSATEALLRSIADVEAVPITGHSVQQVMKSLYTYGVLDKTQYQTLQDGLQTRTMVVHGYKEPRALVSLVEQVLVITDQLQQRYPIQ